VIIILIIVPALSWFKQKVSSYHLKNSTSEGPNVSRSVIVSSNDNFRRAVLPSLNFRCEVVVGPTPVAHVTNFYLYILADAGTPPVYFGSFDFIPLLRWLFVFIAEKSVELGKWCAQPIQTVRYSFDFLLCELLTLLHDCFAVDAKLYITYILSFLALRLVIIKLRRLYLRLFQLPPFLLQLLFLVFGQLCILSTILRALGDFTLAGLCF
jgi:hypothetical protein